MTDPAVEPVPAGHGRRRGLAWLGLMAMMAAVLLLPYYLQRMEGAVERLQYANTRGRQRALADDAQRRLATLNDASETFRLVAHSVEPAVVHIDTLRTMDMIELAEQSEKDRPDGEASAPAQNGRGSADLPALHTTGQGSGVIVDQSGYILTNYHVIHEAAAVYVRLSDGRSVREVEVVGLDPATDLALLKIEETGLTAACWGDSQVLEVGDWVLAVGNPFGLDRSVTAGIVSAKRRRQIVENMTYQDFLQTDASVNPGSSGGPLLNMRGEVVGINTAIVGQGYQGISFAIPSEIARDVYDRLRTDGSVVRGWLGIAMAPAEDDISDSGVRKPRAGALVENVFPGTPAEKAGIRPRDVIVRWNSQPVADHTDLGLLVARTDVDSVARVELMRGEEQLTLEVTVAQRPDKLPQ
jgi:serine protease Do